MQSTIMVKPQLKQNLSWSEWCIYTVGNGILISFLSALYSWAQKVLCHTQPACSGSAPTTTSSEHLIISEIHLRKSILITWYGAVDAAHALFMHSAISVLTPVKDVWTGIHPDKIDQSRLQIGHMQNARAWNNARCSRREDAWMQGA